MNISDNDRYILEQRYMLTVTDIFQNKDGGYIC
jgi:hypothetical protein